MKTRSLAASDKPEGTPMRFFVRMTERNVNDPQELAAMLLHRLASINYQYSLMREEGPLAYAFRNRAGTLAVLMYETDTLEKLDFFLKRDPGWQYAETDVMPVVSTEALVREAQDYLGETIIGESELGEFRYERRKPDSKQEYWLAYKQVKPFSPLLSLDAQNDVHRRTVIAQKAHLESLEFADDNPVGKAVGILVAEAAFDDVKQHVESCEVYPDTQVIYTELLPLERAWEVAVGETHKLGRSIPEGVALGSSTVAAAKRTKEAIS
jgi:hypothetical protein